MKRLLILPLVLLASCAPAIQKLQGTADTLTTSDGLLTFSNADSSPALGVVVAVDGPDAVEGCAAPRDGVSVCKLGTVSAASNVTLKFVGKLIDANATWRTAGGKLHGTVLSR